MPEARFERASPTLPFVTGLATLPGGGRSWWAHIEFTRINIEPAILRKKIEDVREVDAHPLDFDSY